MIPIKENEFFQFMRNRHDPLLTSDEIDEIERRVHKGNDMREFWIAEIRNKISIYRLINLTVLGIFVAIGWQWGLRFIILLFVIYNLISFIRDRWLIVKYKRRDRSRNWGKK